MKAQPTIRKTLISVVSLLLAVSLALGPGLPYGQTVQAESTSSYIVQAQSTQAAAALVAQAGGTVSSRLALINAVAARLDARAAARLAARPGVRLTLNSTVEAVDYEGPRGVANSEQFAPESDYPDVVGADVAVGLGVDGSGVAVAILDTGIANHKGLVYGTDGLKGHITGWVDFVEGKRGPVDPNGHGTHIAGIIANTQIGPDEEYNGVAPGADLVGVRVLDKDGAGTYETVIQGLDWVLENKEALNIRVVNLSLVSPAQSAYWVDPLNQAVTKLWANGITVVAAAGNGGYGPMTIGVPGNNPYVITAGAFSDNFTPYSWDDDYLTPWSAAGPTLDGFVKPDLLAPGAHMASTMLPRSAIAQEHESELQGGSYFSMAGTSQSAAVVSGVSALVISHNPEITPDQVKFRLQVTAFPWLDLETDEALYSMWQQGYGRLNAPDAIFQEIDGTANGGMNILADLAGEEHYEGYSYYDSEAGVYRLRGESYGTWSGGYGTWSGSYGTWSGGYGTWSGGYGTWSGSYGTWSGGYGTWSGGYGTWSGGYGTWSGGYGTWSGGYGTWSGGYGTWSGGYGTWSGSEPWIGTLYSDPNFVEQYLEAEPLDATTVTTSINTWIEE